MDNNDVFRRLRYIFNFNENKIIEIFQLANYPVDEGEVNQWLQKEDDKNFKELKDPEFATFLNGFIYYKRGKQEGKTLLPESTLNNNIIFRKLKIALNLKSDDIINLFHSIDKQISPHELNAFFRNPNQRQYRPCNDQYFRYFLNGLLKNISKF